MAKESPIINILTYKLDFTLSRQIFNEYQSRLKEATYLIDNYNTYHTLKANMKTVEIVLALSIFHKRVIANLDAAVKFYGIVNKISRSETIKMGSYALTGQEKNKLLGVTMSYEQLIKKFSISPSLMDYNETKDFLKKLIALKSNLRYAQNQEQDDRREREES
jgi:DNA-binding protein YbaB